MTKNDVNQYLNQLAVKSQSGDSEAKEALCRHFKRYIHNLSHTLYEGWDAEDAEQDLWVYFLECLFRYDASRHVHFRMYVMRHLRWYFLKHFRHKKVENRTIEYVEEAQEVYRGYRDKEISLSEEEIKGILNQCSLTALQRELLDQRLSGKTWHMIAKERKVSRIGMYGHVSRIRSRLLNNQEFQNYFLA